MKKSVNREVMYSFYEYCINSPQGKQGKYPIERIKRYGKSIKCNTILLCKHINSEESQNMSTERRKLL